MQLLHEAGYGSYDGIVLRDSLSRPRSVCPRLSGVEMAKRVLVADDNPTIRKMLCRLFEVEESYDICAEAENGREAIDLALKHRPDLIILDMSMPVLNGTQAAQELKKIMPDVPIILLTQHGNMGKTSLPWTFGSIFMIRLNNLADAIQKMQELATNLQRVHRANPSTRTQAMPTEGVRWWAWGESNSRPTV